MIKDECLIGNEKIEECLSLLKQEPSNETLAVLLTIIRRRMQEKGHFVVSVEPNPGGMQVRKVKLSDGRTIIPVFTSFDEELKSRERVMSGFTADIGQLFVMTLANSEIDGLFLNPWGNSILLDKNLIRVIKGTV